MGEFVLNFESYPKKHIFENMSTESIKIEIINWLTQLDDNGVLTSLLQIKKANEQNDWANNLSKDQLESLQRGLLDLENKNLISSSDFWKSYGRKV